MTRLFSFTYIKTVTISIQGTFQRNVPRRLKGKKKKKTATDLGAVGKVEGLPTKHAKVIPYFYIR